jgi:SPP1 gp7 family putative phage head morphogenesis protein
MNIAAVFGLPPEQALDWWRAKGYAINWGWRDMAAQNHARAFTVAGVMKVDVLQDIRAELDRALAEGRTLNDFKKDLIPRLQAKGWWGKLAQTDMATGEMHGKGLTPRRLDTIFRTNLQSAYMAGRYRQMMANVEGVGGRPWWQYVAIMDSRTRPQHSALHGRVFRYDDPFWQKFYPPLGFNCRCRVRAYTDAEIKARGIDTSISGHHLQHVELPDPYRPGQTVLRPRYEYAPGKYIAPDIGFEGNPGLDALRPFTPPPLDALPRTFPVGVALPELPPATPVPASRLLAADLPAEDYARAFLAEFGADIGKPVVFTDVTGGHLVVGEELFRDGAGAWKADKNGRGPYMTLLADAIRSPDEIWLRWEEARDQPGKWLLKRRYIKTFEVAGENGPQFGLSVFEWGKDGWSGSTVMVAQPERSATSRKRYVERQRDGFMLYRK